MSGMCAEAKATLSCLRICDQFARMRKYLYGNGGPIIAVQIENEFGEGVCIRPVFTYATKHNQAIPRWLLWQPLLVLRLLRIVTPAGPPFTGRGAPVPLGCL